LSQYLIPQKGGTPREKNLKIRDLSMPWKGYRSIESYIKEDFHNAPEGLPFRVLHMK
jgi:hypothetical protein